MTRSTRASHGSKTTARTPHLINLKIPSQTIRLKDVLKRRRAHLMRFSTIQPSTNDTEVNAVTDREIDEHAKRFDIPRSVNLFLHERRAICNPCSGAVTIYGAMLTFGVTLLI